MTLTTVDLFAGCGGLGLGLEQAGFETVFVNELHPNAMQTYLRNRPASLLSNPRNHVLDIRALSQDPAALDALASRLHRAHGDIGLVVGGPPCQGYSHRGHRRSFEVAKVDTPSNHLYIDMATVIAALRPRAFVFENVRGLLTARWTAAGCKGEIWDDVYSHFEALTVKRGRRMLQYRLDWRLVSAAEFGVPQNRPRVILVGVREDILGRSSVDSLVPSGDGGAPDLIDLLGDLVDPAWQPGGTSLRYPSDPANDLQRLLRSAPPHVDGLWSPQLFDQGYAKHSEAIVEKFQHMINNNGQIPEHQMTKKFNQRVMPPRWGQRPPSITVTSTPEDLIHYEQPRIPTVREWARIQMFPDWYRFSGKRTTGGRRRAGDPSIGDWTRDLPQYTQIGNAVPVPLGRAIGEHLRRLIE